jgi:hypothetical protein
VSRPCGEWGQQVSQQTTDRSFDELASGLARGTLSRGRALRLMGAALLGGTLGSLGIGEAAADDLCKPTGKKCRKDHQCCSGNCVNLTCSACPSGTTLIGSTCCPTAKVCGTGASAICCKGDAQSCVEGVCQCDDPGTLPCGEQCVGCEGGTVNSETCLCECPSGTTLIGSTCCPNARVCGSGTSVTCCPEGQQCEGDVCSEPCRPNGDSCTNHDECCSNNCVSGTCAACPAGSTLCGDNCVTNCPSGRTLNPSTCECDCTSGTPCGTQCCQTGFTCVNGTCCPDAQVCDTGTSVTCCPEGRVCESGVCQCPTGTTLCGGSCVSTTCSENQFFDPSTCTCVACRQNGGTCSGGNQCCSGNCSSGTCACQPSGTPGCTDDSQCCSNICSPAGRCCTDAGGPCNAALDCCGIMCQNGRCCRTSGSCTNSNQCCGDLICSGGNCVL